MENIFCISYRFNFIKTVYIFLFLLSCAYYLTAIEIVSIGQGCTVSSTSRRNKLRTTAYPFDWMITSMEALMAAFLDDFTQVLNPEYLYESDDKESVIDGYGLRYVHDFPTINSPETPQDGEVKGMDPLLPNWRDSISIVKAKFNRRLERLLHLLETGQPLALVRYKNMDRNTAKRFIRILKQKYPNAQLVLVVIGSTPNFRKHWHIPHVLNIYMDKKDLEDRHGPVWSETIHTIDSLNPQKW